MLHSIRSPIFNNPMFLISVNELPNLQNLCLSILLHPLKTHYDGRSFETIQFKNVKNFTLNLYEHHSDFYWNDLSSQLLEAIEFESLNSFSVYTNNYFNFKVSDFLVEMVRKNELLQNVIFDSKISILQLSTMVASLRELKEITFNWWDPSETLDTWNRFFHQVIVSHQKLEKLAVKLTPHNPIDYQSLSRAVPSDWGQTQIIVIKNSTIVCFERNK